MNGSGPLLVTAFGPFGGREVNASSLALKELRRAESGLRTRTLSVDQVEAPRRLRAAVKRISPSAILLLGEAGNVDKIRLETRAWNELDFAIPDGSGRQPRGQMISGGEAPFLESGVDVASMIQALDSAGHEVELSTDPGRYLCNLIYFIALSRWNLPIVFVHLPLETKLETRCAMAALRVVVDELRV